MRPFFNVSSCLVVILLGCLFVHNTLAEENTEAAAKQLLTTMMEAMKSLSYQGTVAYMWDDKIETLRVFHAFNDGVEQKRIVALNTPMREVVLNADRLACYFPDARTVLIENHPSRHAFLVNLPENLDEHRKQYRFSLGGHEFILQRQAQIVRIVPKDDFRYRRTFWIDLETKLPLQFELIDENGARVEQMVFTSLSVGDSIPARDLTATTKVDEATWQIRYREPKPVKEQAIEFQWLPDGFRQVLYTQHKLPGSARPIDHVLLSDGFASVSVYLDKFDADSVSPKKFTHGVVRTYTKKLGAYQVTVMGEVPVKTVQAIGDGIRVHAPEE